MIVKRCANKSTTIGVAQQSTIAKWWLDAVGKMSPVPSTQLFPVIEIWVSRFSKINKGDFLTQVDHNTVDSLWTCLLSHPYFQVLNNQI